MPGKREPVDQQLVLRIKTPSLNEMLAARGRLRRTDNPAVVHNSWNSQRKEIERMIIFECRAQKLRAMKHAHFWFHFIEQTKLRDPDNIVAVAHKVVFDGLVRAGILAGDGWKQILSIRDTWECAKAPYLVLVRMREDGYPDAPVVRVR